MLPFRIPKGFYTALESKEMTGERFWGRPGTLSGKSRQHEKSPRAAEGLFFEVNAGFGSSSK
jgi:hypothetical protein